MSGWLSDKGWGGDLASPGPIGNVTPSTGAFTTLSATTSVTSPIVKANGSGGGVLQSSNGTACLQWGAGGGSNVTFDGGVSALDNIIISTAGKGINFTGVTPPAGMTSQLLDDYEEGTWTATITDGTHNATMNATACKYTKIGNVVFVCGNVSTTLLGSVTGDISISGLPFAIATFSGGAVSYATNLNITSGQSVTVLANNSGTSLLLFLWDSAAGTTWMQATEWTNTGSIVFYASYFV